MEIIDLSRTIEPGMPVHPSLPATELSVSYDHGTPITQGATTHSAMALRLTLSDHAGTHVDAPRHFDPRDDAAGVDELPLERFYTGALCLDLSHAPPKHGVTVPEMEEALARAGGDLRAGDTLLLFMRTHERFGGTPGFLTDFPGLAPESVHWIADRGVWLFGVEGLSPAPAGEANLLAHRICAERGITHIEGLENLDRLVGRGRFRFVGFPLKIRGGTGGPMRAVAIFE